MTLKIPLASDLVQLTQLKPLWNTLTLHLFKNNFVPDENSDVTDFVQANFSGYASQATTTWGIPFIDVDRGRMNEVIHDFVHNGGGVSNDIYGYYMLYADGSLAFAERNDLAPVPVGPTVTYSVLPTYTLRQDV